MISTFLMIVFVFLAISHCGGRTPTSSSYNAVNAPGLIHVTNGSTVGFYKTTGGYGFGSQSASIFSLGNFWGGNQPFAQDPVTGVFFFGTNNSTQGNWVFYFSGTTGFEFGSLGPSEMKLQSPGNSTGVGYSSSNKLLYVADPANDVVTYLSSTKPAYGIGNSATNSIFAAPSGLSANFVNVAKNLVAISETSAGSLYFMDATNGNSIFAMGNKTNLPLVSGSTPCSTAALVGPIQVSSNGSQAYLLCGPSVIYISLATSPTYLVSGSLSLSTFATTGITSPTDFVYDSGDGTIIVVGNSRVIALDAQSGALVNTIDLSTYSCGSGLSLGGVAYSSLNKQIYVTDSANSEVYVLESSSFGLATGTCATSVFSTVTDIPGPTKIGFF